MSYKIPVHAKVHAWGERFNSSVDIFVRRNYVLYDIFVAFPGYEEEQCIASGVTEYEIFSEIMKSLAYSCRGRNVQQINITWDYEEVSDS